MSIKKEDLNSLKNKKIALLGLGLENFSLLKFLLKKNIDCEITICDSRSKKELKERVNFLKKDKIKLSLGKNHDKDLEKYDIIMRSPGYPIFSKNLIKAKKAGVTISSPMKLFFDLSPAKIIGVTGTKGKGTISSLIFNIIKTAKKKVYLGGNIGVAPFDFIDKLNKNDLAVLELSSFQLEDMHKSPHIAVIINLYKEHLAPADPKNPNYHKSFAKYWEAKKNIFKHQSGSDYLVANEKLKNKIKVGKKNIFFKKSNLKSNLVGEHNKENIAAANEVARILKIKKAVIEKAVKNFNGLPHRIEFVAEIEGVKYYDDSFATTPESGITALKSFSPVIAIPPGREKQSRDTGDKTRLPRRSAPRNDKDIILLAGGADKGSDFKELVKEIEKRVKYLILFKGKGTKKIKNEIQNSKFKIQNSVVDNMKDAIKIAKSKARAGDIILLSTGCASFGIFKNYKERGDLFKEEIRNKE